VPSLDAVPVTVVGAVNDSMQKCQESDIDAQHEMEANTQTRVIIGPIALTDWLAYLQPFATVAHCFEEQEPELEWMRHLTAITKEQSIK